MRTAQVVRSIARKRGVAARLHRRLTGLSGFLLFACMFLPAIKGCHESVMPYEVPPFVPPYLYGLVFALIAIARSPRGLALGVLALRVLASLVIICGVVLLVVATPVGIFEILIGGVLLVTIGLYGTTEARVAATGIAIGAVCVLWFSWWSLTPDALEGVYLSLASSVGLLGGCLAWLRALAHRPAVDMPYAIAALRRAE